MPFEKKENDQETKADLFVRLATKRTQSVLKSIRILGNCSSKNYEYNQAQIDKISETLLNALELMLGKFTVNITEQEKFEL